MKKKDNIIDNIHGNICISKFEKKIISTKTFNRLHDISQSSVLYLTFPSNRTKRFEHSIGTMHLAGLMFKHAISNAEEKTLTEFFDKIDNEFISLFGEKYYDKIDDEVGKNGFYIESIPTHNIIINKDFQKKYLLVFQSVRLAGLLHDIGHPPYSHILEEVLKSEFIRYNNGAEIADKKNDFVKVMQDIMDVLELDEQEVNLNERVLHERLGNKIARKLVKYIENIDDSFGCMLSTITYNILNEDNDFYRGLHRLIASDVDADRLDYINRDSINSGLSREKIEYSRLFSNMKLISEDNQFYFAFNMKTIDLIDRFLQARSRIYTEMNYHHRNIKMSYLLASIVEDLMNDYFSNKSPNCQNIDYLWKPLMELADILHDKMNVTNIEESVEKFLQWTDSWLITELRSLFLSENYKKIDNYIFKAKMEELLTNKKIFISLIKNRGNFNILDKKLVDRIKQLISDDKIEKYMKKCDLATYHLPYNDEEAILVIKFKDFIEKLYSYDKSINGFFFRIYEMYDKFVSSYNSMTDFRFNKLIREASDALFEKFKNNVVIVHNSFKDHKGEEVALYTNNDSEVYWYNDYSSFNQVNMYSYLYVPSIFIFINEKLNNLNTKNEIFNIVVDVFANKIVKDINDTITDFVEKIILSTTKEK